MTQARNLPRWTGAKLFHRPLPDLSDSSSRHIAHLFLPLSFYLISLVLDLLTLSPFTTLHCLFSFTSLCHTDDLLLCPRLSASLFLFLYLSFDFVSLSVSLSQVHYLISSVLFVLLSFRGQCRAPYTYLRIAVSPLWSCSEVFNPPVS